MERPFVNGIGPVIGWNAAQHAVVAARITAHGFLGTRVDGGYAYWQSPNTEFEVPLITFFAGYKGTGLTALITIYPYVPKNIEWNEVAMNFQVWRRPPDRELAGPGSEKSWAALRRQIKKAIVLIGGLARSNGVKTIIQFHNEPAWGGNGGPLMDGATQNGALDVIVDPPNTEWLKFCKGKPAPSVGDVARIPPGLILPDSAPGTTSRQDAFYSRWADPGTHGTMGYGTWDNDADWARLAVLTGKAGYLQVKGLHELFTYMLDPVEGVGAECRKQGLPFLLGGFLGQSRPMGIGMMPTLPQEMHTLFERSPAWLNQFDGFACHAYAGDRIGMFCQGGEAYGRSLGSLAEASERMIRPYIGDVPVWFTEYGHDRPWLASGPYVHQDPPPPPPPPPPPVPPYVRVVGEQERGLAWESGDAAIAAVATGGRCLFGLTQTQVGGQGEDFGLYSGDGLTTKLSNGAFRAAAAPRVLPGPPGPAYLGSWRSLEEYDDANFVTTVP